MTAIFVLGVLIGIGLAVTYYIHHIPPMRGDE